jgi:hypothetical protein
MNRSLDKKSQTRIIIALSLFALSILASFLISYSSHMGERYWVLKRPLARGTEIEARDIRQLSSDIDRSINAYLTVNDSPIGMYATRNLRAGEFISIGDIQSYSPEFQSASISLSLRVTDLPSGVRTGQSVDLYQVHDSRNGEVTQPPSLIVSGAYLSSLKQKSSNFASDIAATFIVRDSQVLDLLTATASGRLAVVARNG